MLEKTNDKTYCKIFQSPVNNNSNFLAPILFFFLQLYQMAEVNGKIGFVPLSNLVAAEQVEGMQAFVQDRGRNERPKVISHAYHETMLFIILSLN